MATSIRDPADAGVRRRRGVKVCAGTTDDPGDVGIDAPSPPCATGSARRVDPGARPRLLGARRRPARRGGPCRSSDASPTSPWWTRRAHPCGAATRRRALGRELHLHPVSARCARASPSACARCRRWPRRRTTRCAWSPSASIPSTTYRRCCSPTRTPRRRPRPGTSSPGARRRSRRSRAASRSRWRHGRPGQGGLRHHAQRPLVLVDGQGRIRGYYPSSEEGVEQRILDDLEASRTSLSAASRPGGGGRRVVPVRAGRTT